MSEGDYNPRVTKYGRVLARMFWWFADQLDRIPGFTEGTEREYDRRLERDARCKGFGG